MSRLDPRASADKVSWGAALAVLDLGYAFEMLRFWAHYLWLGADEQTQSPALLESYLVSAPRKSSPPRICRR